MIKIDLEGGRRGRQQPPLRYPAVGFCIYCGSTINLTNEHILPYGLGGRTVLPSASCMKCAKITSAIERACLRTMFGDLRSAFNMKRRKRKDKDKYKPRPMLAHVGRTLVPYQAPNPNQRLNAAFMYAFYEPTILAGVTPTERKHRPFDAAWVHGSLGSQAASTLKAATSTDITRLASVASFHPVIFSKMIAKIGYAFAMAGARGRFKPIIAKAIIGEEPWVFGYLVGGEPEQPSPSTSSAEIDLLRITAASGTEYLMARVRLFGDLGAPAYYVVVGEL